MTPLAIMSSARTECRFCPWRRSRCPHPAMADRSAPGKALLVMAAMRRVGRVLDTCNVARRVERTNLCTVLSAMARPSSCRNHGGCQWRLVPHEFPSWNRPCLAARVAASRATMATP
jgi:hypothetical protein